VRKDDETWALFWCSLLHPLLFGEVDPKDTQRFLKALASEARRFPDGTFKTASLSTLRRKLRAYRTGGFDALFRRRRADRGKPRAHAPELIARAIELKRDLGTRSEETLNQFLRVEGGKTLPKSTLYRYLRKAGATRLKLGLIQKKVRRRWTRPHTHDLWIGDFEDGPYVLEDGRAVETHLCAFLDCHSRFAVVARYYRKEDFEILVDAFLCALVVHGAPRAIYVDNGKVFHARAFKAGLYSIDVGRLHRQKGDPPPGGLIERFFRTAQSQFEAEVRHGKFLTLEQLNRAFVAWLEVSYHRRKNDETGEPPEARYHQGLTVLRPVSMEKVLRHFLHRETRRVHKDFADVQLHGRFYRVDKRYRGDRVEVRYDPFSARDTVLLYSLDEAYLGQGVLHHREQGEEAAPPPVPKPRYSYLDLLIQEHEKQLEARAKGVDYRAAMAHRRWPFPAFLKALAQCLGRKGDLTAFSTDELEALQKIYDRHPSLTEPELEEAVVRATEKTLPYIAHELEKLSSRKER
jgi:putative transposase